MAETLKPDLKPIHPAKPEAKEKEPKGSTEAEMTELVTDGGWEPVKDAAVPTFTNTVPFTFTERRGSRQTSVVPAGIVRRLKDAYELELLRPKEAAK